jgi:dTDP-glucose 4,6-dehydratase
VPEPISNLDIGRRLLRILDKPDDQIGFVKDRLGHDFRYALYTKEILHQSGWKIRGTSIRNCQ